MFDTEGTEGHGKVLDEVTHAPVRVSSHGNHTAISPTHRCESPRNGTQTQQYTITDHLSVQFPTQKKDSGLPAKKKMVFWLKKLCYSK